MDADRGGGWFRRLPPVVVVVFLLYTSSDSWFPQDLKIILRYQRVCSVLRWAGIYDDDVDNFSESKNGRSASFSRTNVRVVSADRVWTSLKKKKVYRLLLFMYGQSLRGFGPRRFTMFKALFFNLARQRKFSHTPSHV